MMDRGNIALRVIVNIVVSRGRSEMKVYVFLYEKDL